MLVKYWNSINTISNSLNGKSIFLSWCKVQFICEAGHSFINFIAFDLQYHFLWEMKLYKTNDTEETIHAQIIFHFTHTLYSINLSRAFKIYRWPIPLIYLFCLQINFSNIWNLSVQFGYFPQLNSLDEDHFWHLHLLTMSKVLSIQWIELWFARYWFLKN